tara:strand:+ start:46 stop:1152 length:1107 start_codon:yes stop_codon:yes gene_type:complete
MEKNTKVVYLHRKATDGTTFYVGMGNSDRVNNTTSRNKWWRHTYNKYGLKTEIVASDLSIECAYELEVFLISELGRKDKGLGNLVNMDDGGKGASGHIPTASARRKLSERMSKKVINTETLEVLKSGAELLKNYGIFRNGLNNQHPNSDWMRLEDYDNGKHLTEKWINRYKIKNSYLKIINTETNEVFYSIEAASVSRGKANCKVNESQYNVLSQKLKESSDTIRKKVNNTDFMYYSDYENGRHLTKEWINRKIRKPSVTNKPDKNINIYDFKEQVWITTTSRKFEELYNIKPIICNSFLNGRFCREEYSKFDKKNNQWKNVINIKTKEVERFNQWYLGDKLGVKSNNLSSFFRGIQKKAYGTYMIVQ